MIAYLFIIDNNDTTFQELCPFPRDQIEQVLSNYYAARDFVWCQEEPQNAGAYSFIAPRLTQLLPYQSKVCYNDIIFVTVLMKRLFFLQIEYVGKPPLAAPAVGIASRYRAEQAKVIQDALTL